MQPHACRGRSRHGIESVESKHCSLAQLVGRAIRDEDLALLVEGARVHTVERRRSGMCAGYTTVALRKSSEQLSTPC